MCTDKDNEKVLEILQRSSSIIITTQVKNPRAIDAEELASHVHGDIETHVITEPEKALETAVKLAGTDGLVLVTGSLYLVGDIMRYYGLQSECIY
jgi:dihydrofolate synthase/folylpolyglutamate synthase